jgi:hypothetical protein
MTSKVRLAVVAASLLFTAALLAATPHSDARPFADAAERHGWLVNVAERDADVAVALTNDSGDRVYVSLLDRPAGAANAIALLYENGQPVGARATGSSGAGAYDIRILPGVYSDEEQILSAVAAIDAGPELRKQLTSALATVRDAITLAATSCCGQTQDGYKNTFPCCAPGTGNCTWFVESQTPGDNNFDFNGQRPRDAYTWLSLGYSSPFNPNNPMSFGGTIPAVGGVLVLTKITGRPQGHVAKITAIQSNGTVSVREQNCDLTCTRDKTYDAAFLRTNLAGYIYSTGSAPAWWFQAIAGSKVGDATIVDDYTFSDHYSFNAEGPGHAASFNGGLRAWGTGSTGAYNNYFHYTATKSGSSVNSGKWAFNIATAGLYAVEAYIPNTTTITATRARYKVASSSGVSYSAALNQSTNRGKWVKVMNPAHAQGWWRFATGTGGGIRLEDNYGTNSPEDGKMIGFDALRFTYEGN